MDPLIWYEFPDNNGMLLARVALHYPCQCGVWFFMWGLVSNDFTSFLDHGIA